VNRRGDEYHVGADQAQPGAANTPAGNRPYAVSTSEMLAACAEGLYRQPSHDSVMPIISAETQDVAKSTSSPPTKAKTKAAPPAAKAAAKPVAKAPAKSTGKAAVKPTPKPAVTVTLKHLAVGLAERHDMAKKQADAVLGDIFGMVVDHLKSGDRVRISGVGIIEVKDRPARMGRNPATGEAIQIKASRKVAFRAAKELKEAI
jgi:DNA-binding protein HU-beta